jgi:hypothetical protein
MLQGLMLQVLQACLQQCMMILAMIADDPFAPVETTQSHPVPRSRNFPQACEKAYHA